MFRQIVRPPSAVGLAFLLMGGPFLLFPELLPVTLRPTVVPLLSVLALAGGTALVRPWPVPFWGITGLSAALCLGWLAAPETAAPSLRHFAGVGLGVLTMAVIGRGFASQTGLVLIGAVYAGATAAICVFGLIGAYITRTKLLLDATQQLSTAMYPWLPHWQLGLPGLEASQGWVNPNALGGTALMLLPVCLGCAGAGWLTKPKRRWLVAVGLLSALLCGTAVGLTHSRTALLAGALTCGVAAAFWKAARQWLVAGVLVALSVGGIQLWRTSQAAPENFSLGVALAKANVGARVEIWRAGLGQLRTRPLTGVGVNQFHQIAAPDTGEPMYVAHAHNVFLQVALDAGIPGLVGYLVLLGALLHLAVRVTRAGGIEGALAAGASLSLVAVHLWGLGDAIALGAKVGLFQWIAAGLILATSTAASADTLPVSTGEPDA